MAKVLVVSCEEALSKVVAEAADATTLCAPSHAEVFAQIRRTHSGIDTLVIGGDVRDPIRIVQYAHGVDSDLEVVLLADAADAPNVRRDLQYAYRVGSHVACHPWPTPDIHAVLCASTKRTRRRRIHRSRLRAASSAIGTSVTVSIPKDKPMGVFRTFDARVRELTEFNTALLEELAEERRRSSDAARTERDRVLRNVAVGLNHNVNNLLMGLLTPAQMILRSQVDPGTMELARMVSTSAERMKDLVIRFSESVGAVAAEELELVDPDDVVRQVVGERLRGDIPRDIDVRLRPAGVPRARATRAGLVQVVEHLVRNAVEAVQGSGAVDVETCLDGDFVAIVVRDTGVGMASEVLASAFDPLYTTSAHLGRGLGLALSRTLVNQWGGTLTGHSEPGKGSTFVVRMRKGEETGKQGDGEIGR